MVVKNAMMLCVGNKDWVMPKSVLVETNGKYGDRLDDIAFELFEKYKNGIQNKDVYLVGYSYHGDIELIEVI